MDIRDLAGGLGIEVNKLLAGRGLGCLLVIRSQSSKERVDTGSDAIGVIDGLGLVGCMILGVELGESLDEAAAYTMLLVEFDGTLNGLITDSVSVGKVFSNDTAAGLLLLGDLIAVSLGFVLVVASIVIVATSGAGDLNLSGTELCVVEEEGSLGSGFLLEGYSGILSGLGFGDIEAGDLSTVKS